VRDLLKEFDNDVKVVREWYTDDSGKPNERFIVTRRSKDLKNYPSMRYAMDKAMAIASRGNRQPRN